MNELEVMPVAGRRNQVGFTTDRLSAHAGFEDRPLTSSIAAPVWKGYALILVFVVGFGIWAGYAPLAGGAIAHGIISTNSSRRVVQHLEGGIIRELKVKDGDVVTEGQPLVVLEPVQPRSAHEAVLAQRDALLARKARLEAEKSGKTSVEFPNELLSGGALVPLAISQKDMFEARSAAHQARRNVLQQKIQQLNEQIKGFKAQLDSIGAQQTFIHEELAAKLKLVEQGLLPRPESLRLQRAESELVARRAEFETEIRKATQQIGETNLEMLSADAARLDEVTSGLDKVSTEMSDVMERLQSSEDVLKRTTITAPVSGSVINLRFKTVGGVVQRGEPVLEIVPNDDALIIEARVSPNDIRLVHPGQAASIHLSAYSFRTMPRIDGIVLSASPDRVTDSRGDQSYYLARIEVDREDLKKRAQGVALIPGMAADVIFVTEERTLLNYLLGPLLDVLRRGLRET
jgi:HlyD family secretion protein